MAAQSCTSQYNSLRCCGFADGRVQDRAQAEELLHLLLLHPLLALLHDQVQLDEGARPRVDEHELLCARELEALQRLDEAGDAFAGLRRTRRLVQVASRLLGDHLDVLQRAAGARHRAARTRQRHLALGRSPLVNLPLQERGHLEVG
eukprot:CAMPEP_0185483994 /NCGR_PEP_ID=MMETSP1366-20130426/8975_1 /TAXON_ID=38817 /ORGANISM="Gephyrocapsa oceanica, Strain RCC1303" /LENGTH=146 /DNA_ID=CAMNT_0028091995 /DNA_START=42 /DNA_END=482 /DNA_ORIENTATION=+